MPTRQDEVFLSFFSLTDTGLTSEYQSDCTRDIQVSILIDEDGERVQAGSIILSVIDMGRAAKESIAPYQALQSGIRAGNFFDEMMAQAPVYERWITAKHLAGQEAWPADIGNLMLIHLVEVDPSFTGRGLAVLALRGLLSLLDFGCKTAILHARPMQFVEGSGFVDRYGISQDEATKKIKHIYSMAGFMPIGDSNFMLSNI